MTLKLSKRRALVRQQMRAIDLENVRDPAMRLLPRAGRSRCDAKAKARLIDGLMSGQTLWEMLATDASLPSYSAIYSARQTDAEFDAAFVAARAQGLSNRIEEGVAYAGSVRENKHLAIGAEKYMNAVVKAAEKLAPKTYGPMLKHADADGEKLSITVMDYKQSQSLPAVDAQFTELPAPATNNK